jgi:hypothetical protein
MDLSFDLKTLVAVEITGEVLIVDGIHAPTVLDQMLRQYEDEDIGVCTSALGIADLVFSAGETIDKSRADCIVQEMAMLAHDLLREEGAGEWAAPTLDALRKIRATFP